jgi:DNA-binding CsgD family transcriptional regulator/PAS domain-containing protein
MGAAWNLDTITEAFAAAAVDSSRWDAAMEVVADSTGAAGALLFPVRGYIPNVPFSPSMAGPLEKYIADGWIHRDVRYQCHPIAARQGIATEFDIITPDEIARHPYYQEFLAPFGLRWFAGVKVACGDDYWALSIQRTIDQGPFSVAEQGELVELSNRLASSAAVARALSFARAEATVSAFEISGTAVLLLDIRREVLQANEAAERLFGPDLQIVGRRIVSFDHAATKALDRTLHQLLWTRSGSASTAPVILPRRDKRPVVACPIRVANVTGTPLGDCQAIVVLVDLDRQERPPHAVLHACFGLTSAEANLAASLAAGATLEGAADQLGICKETARSQLKAVFDKTQTHRQAELVALMARMVIPIDLAWAGGRG